MAQNAPKPDDVVTNFIYKWGGIAILVAVIILIVAYVLSVAASLMISTINALDKAAGALGLVAVGALVGAVVGIGIYVYVKQRITP